MEMINIGIGIAQIIEANIIKSVIGVWIMIIMLFASGIAILNHLVSTIDILRWIPV